MNKFKELYWVLLKSKELEVYRAALFVFSLIGWMMGFMIYGFVIQNLYFVFLAWTPFFIAIFYIIYLIGRGFVRDFKEAWMTRYYTIDKIKNKHRYE